MLLKLLEADQINLWHEVNREASDLSRNALRKQRAKASVLKFESHSLHLWLCSPRVTDWLNN